MTSTSTPARRIALGVEYDGRGLHGWQRQANAPSVQALLEAALGRVANHAVGLVCAGRTDAGVHAVGQVVHFDTTAHRPLHAWVLGANANLPGGIAVQWAREVGTGFHARFSAWARSYRYLLLNRRVRPAVLRGLVTWERRPLDVARMAAATPALLGEHDFSAFRAAGCQARSPVRTLQRLEVSRHGDLVVIDARADAFLHHMVRNLAGVLARIGAGEAPVGWAAEVLQGRDRRLGGVTAPPDGLYLTAVRYPPGHGLPEPPQPPLLLAGGG